MRKKKTKEEYLLQVKEIHMNLFDYSLVTYENSKSLINIICSDHGMFSQRADHLAGKGCFKCKQSHGEIEISKYLIKHGINFELQKRFRDCADRRPLPFDFYLPKYNMCIEYNGIQHYKPVGFFGGEKKFEYQKKRDKIKKDYCRKNAINLLIISYQDDIGNMLLNCQMGN